MVMMEWSGDWIITIDDVGENIWEEERLIRKRGK